MNPTFAVASVLPLPTTVPQRLIPEGQTFVKNFQVVQVAVWAWQRSDAKSSRNMAKIDMRENIALPHFSNSRDAGQLSHEQSRVAIRPPGEHQFHKRPWP